MKKTSFKLRTSRINRAVRLRAGLQIVLTLSGAALGLIFSHVAFPAPGFSLTAAIAAVFVLSQILCGAFAFETVSEMTNEETAAVLLSSLLGAVITITLSELAFKSLVSVNAAVIASLAVTVLILTLRLLESVVAKRSQSRRPDAVPTIIVGSGDAAASLVKLVRENRNFAYAIVGCVDDDPLTLSVNKSRILGNIDDLPELIAKFSVGSVIIAIPSASAQLIKRVMNCCMEASGFGGKAPAVKILPGVMELLNDGVKVSRIRAVQPEDLLPRDPVRVDLSEIVPHVENRVILVTGAGGSIGSELCRQIVGLNPSLLLLLGHGENSLFAIDEELRLQFQFNRTKIILADVADAARIRSVFSQYKPHVVFHAAAHKHVPIVEANVCEAVRNNILGTHVVALAAAAAGAAKFVLLSTDKAVNPTSVMGATKRLSEIISQSFVNQTGTEFVTVRFGNVLASRGSVIPIFKKQIENGGPVTITHRDMQRYFMTIPEAVSLVLQGMAVGRDGQVLVLDMGKPVNILSLAKTLITLSGLTPYRDIDIVETGIRPGEKLFEEILTSHEGLSTTSHARVFIAQQERVGYETLALGLHGLEGAVRTGDQRLIVDILRNFVPSFQPGAHLYDEEVPTDTTDRVMALEPAGFVNGHAQTATNGKSSTSVDPESGSDRSQGAPQAAGVLGS